jgi:hypothetical protein
MAARRPPDDAYDCSLARAIAVVLAAFLAPVVLGTDELVELHVDRALGRGTQQILENAIGLIGQRQ